MEKSYRVSSKKKEKKEEYQKTKSVNDKEKREGLKKSKKDGTEQERNMYFLEIIKKRLGYNNNSLSKKVGISPQMLSWWFVTDDAKLSNVLMVCDKIGIKLTMSFENKNENGSVYSGEGFELRGVIPEAKVNERVDAIVDNCIKKNGNLKPLAELIKRLQLSLTSFSEKIGSDYANLCRWLENDDIKISKLYKAASATNQKLIWTAMPKGKKD